MTYLSTKEFRFINTSKKCCVGFIDLVNSTADALSIIDEVKLEAYSLFINNTTKIIKKYDGIVKNIGDCLLFYFPKTDYKRKINELNKVLECFIDILQRRNRLNDDLIEENLPPFNYRITIDYGPLYFALTGVVNQIDIFGSIINICSKLKSLSMPNTVNIGENLYLRFLSFPVFAHIYKFSYSGEYTITDKNNYEFTLLLKLMKSQT
ncbi:MAG: adenylate/guanylate cyclase domain-containing protein [Nitrososphaeraceae archaeon]|nr:adenylate/guanylate cyclase domain-containing protein [Nitrososphaeraceae archaeon]